MKTVSLSKIGRYCFAACLGLLLFVGLSAFVLSFTSMSQSEGIHFIWEMVGFSFLLATLVYSVNPKSLRPNQAKNLPIIGIFFIVSGVFVIVGYGLAVGAANANPSYSQEGLKMMGQLFFLMATFCLAAGMAMMTLGFITED